MLHDVTKNSSKGRVQQITIRTISGISVAAIETAEL